MKFLVCGARDWWDREFLYSVLDQFHVSHPITLIIQGKARGADLMAEDWAVSRQVEWEGYPADWERHHRAAGPIRNRVMLDRLLSFPPQERMLIAFHDDLESSKGTKNMVTIAAKALVPYRVYPVDGMPRRGPPPAPPSPFQSTGPIKRVANIIRPAAKRKLDL